MINKNIKLYLLITTAIFLSSSSFSQSVTEIKKFKVTEAKQAVAVDDQFFLRDQ
ncbi:hypothetical protein [Dyadobacter subterraneus]|uniref:hypothetical protein n=1 Tax=Dyadobacter subterraneus TaxID=2773304 RepID=UPI0036D22CBF